MIRLYVSGRITGDPNWRSRFDAAAASLRAAGYEVISPSDRAPETDDAPWEYHMRRDIKALMDCDGVAFLMGWNDSRGACLEHMLASEVGIECRFVESWLLRVERLRKKLPA